MLRVCTLQDALAPAHVRPVHDDLAVEAPGAQQRRVEHVGAVRGRDEDHAVVRVEAVHLDEQLVERLLALVVPAAEARAAMTADGVDLVDEHDAIVREEIVRDEIVMPIEAQVVDRFLALDPLHFADARPEHGGVRQVAQPLDLIRSCDAPVLAPAIDLLAHSLQARPRRRHESAFPCAHGVAMTECTLAHTDGLASGTQRLPDRDAVETGRRRFTPREYPDQLGQGFVFLRMIRSHQTPELADPADPRDHDVAVLAAVRCVREARHDADAEQRVANELIRFAAPGGDRHLRLVDVEADVAIAVEHAAQPRRDKRRGKLEHLRLDVPQRFAQQSAVEVGGVAVLKRERRPALRQQVLEVLPVEPARRLDAEMDVHDFSHVVVQSDFRVHECHGAPGIHRPAAVRRDQAAEVREILVHELRHA